MQQTITDTARRILSHVSRVGPGAPIHWTDAIRIGEYAHQGDLILVRVARPPRDFTLVPNPTDADRQLVPEAGAGSHHRLRSLEGVDIYRPVGYGPDMEGLLGPCVVFGSPNAIDHEPGTDTPHGTHFIDAPMTIQCRYQRNLDAETRRERRAAD